MQDLRVQWLTELLKQVLISRNARLNTVVIVILLCLTNNIVVLAQIPYFLHYDIFHFSSSKSYQTCCRLFVFPSMQCASHFKQAAVIFSLTLFQDVSYFS